METRTYYEVVDADGNPTPRQRKKLWTPKYGYQLLKTAIRNCPSGYVVRERHTDGWNDWSGRVVHAGP